MDHPVRVARKAKGLTQVDLAERCECGQATISEIERGEYSPSLSLAKRLAVVLGSSMDELFSSSEVA